MFLPWTEAEVRSRPSAGIELAVSETRLDVVPGAEASLGLNIRNTGRNVDRVDFDIEGVADGWAVIEPGTISLLPGAGAVARLHVRPPRDAIVAAGQHLLVLHARSAVDRAVGAEQRVTVDVAPFEDLRVRMTPPTSRGTTRGVHRVVVENASNHALTVSLEGRDPDGAGDVAVELEPSVLQLERGTGAAVVATVIPTATLTHGPARPRPFAIVAQAGPTETDLDGVMIQEPEPVTAAAIEPPQPTPPTPHPTRPVEPAPHRRRRRWWPVLLTLVTLLGGLAAAALAFVPFDEVRDRLDGGDDTTAVPDDVAADAPAEAEPGDVAPVLPDLTITAVECALVPETGELRFAVQVANQGAPFGDPVVVRAASDDLDGSTEIVVDGLATGVLGVPVDAELLGQQLEFTIAIDPGEVVEEADEGNNAGVITITLPASADQPVSLCD